MHWSANQSWLHIIKGSGESLSRVFFDTSHSELVKHARIWNMVDKNLSTVDLCSSFAVLDQQSETHLVTNLEMQPIAICRNTIRIQETHGKIMSCTVTGLNFINLIIEKFTLKNKIRFSFSFWIILLKIADHTS